MTKSQGTRRRADDGFDGEIGRTFFKSVYPVMARRDLGVDAGNGVGHVIKITQKQIRNEL
jgi:hypothetical protein